MHPQTDNARPSKLWKTVPLAAALLWGAIASGPAWAEQEANRAAPPVPADPRVAPPAPVVIVPPVPRRPVPGRALPVELTAVGATVSISDQVATTQLELTLTNRSGHQQEAQIILPVPDGVAVRSLQYDGVGPEPTALVLPRDEARAIYQSIVNSMRDPALVEFVGYNLIKTSAFPVPPGSSQKLRLTYEQVVKADGGRVDYILPRSEALAGGELAWNITFDIRDARPITTVYSPSHEVATERRSETHVRCRLTPAPGGDRGAVRLSYVLAAEGAATGPAFTFLASPDGPNGGHFLMIGGFPSGAKPSQDVKREVVLVIDRSGSMRGEKFKQAVEAARQVVLGLREGESFNIVDYSDSIASFASAPVVKTESTAADALKYLADLTPNGGTNIHDALLEALRPAPAPGVLPMVLFLTDGLPTIGERSEVKIREAVAVANTHKRRIFTFGVGFDVNTPLLDRIAGSSRAAPTFVLPNEDIEVKVSQVFRRLSGPLLELPAVKAATDAEARRIRDMLPRELMDVFEGDQIVVLGAYSGQEKVTFTLHGDYRGTGSPGPMTFTFDPATATTRNGYVSRLWANRKVAALIDEIRQSGAAGTVSSDDPRYKEIVDEIVRLSVKYGILTEYTAFLAKEETKFGVPAGAPGSPSAAASENLRRSMEERGGAGGVQQQMDMEAKSYSLLAFSNRVWVARDMSTGTTGAMQNIADKTFYYRNNRWVDAGALDKEAEAPDEEVAFGSERYFEVLDELRAENRQGALAQEGDVLLVHNNRRLLIKAPAPGR